MTPAEGDDNAAGGNCNKPFERWIRASNGQLFIRILSRSRKKIKIHPERALWPPMMTDFLSFPSFEMNVTPRRSLP